MSGLRQDGIKIKNEYFTLGTLAMFYIDAAKAGGMEYFGYARFDGDDGVDGEDGWDEVFNGPNLVSIAADWRPKPAPPTVRWVIRFDDGDIYDLRVFETEESATAQLLRLLMDSNAAPAKVIKLTEEV